MQQVIMRPLRLTRLPDGRRGQRLRTLALVLAQDPHRVHRKRRTTAFLPDKLTDFFEVLLQPSHADPVQLVRHPCRVSRSALHGKVSCSSANEEPSVVFVETKRWRGGRPRKADYALRSVDALRARPRPPPAG